MAKRPRYRRFCITLLALILVPLRSQAQPPAAGLDTANGVALASAAPKTAATVRAVAEKYLPYDWSARHLIFSDSADQRRGQAEQLEPRYWYQRLNRDREAQLSSLSYHSTVSQHPGRAPNKKEGHKNPPSSLKGDWSVNLGWGASVGPGNYPAEFSFDIDAPPSCTNDFVVFNTSLPGTSSPISAEGTLTFSLAAGIGDTLMINAGVAFTFENGTGGSAPNTVVNGSTAADSAGNLAAAIMDDPTLCATTSPCFARVSAANASVTASATGPVTTLTAKTSGPSGNSISLQTTSSVITLSGDTLDGGANGQASIVAFNNLYVGGSPACGTPLPFRRCTGPIIPAAISRPRWCFPATGLSWPSSTRRPAVRPAWFC